MGSTYSVSELAREAGVPASTVRYYVRRGLLPPDGRTESNYRIYSARSLGRLRFIRAAQSSGFTLGDIAKLLVLMDGSPEPCGEVRDLIASRLDAVDRRVSELTQAREILARAMDGCRQAARTDECHVVVDLQGCGAPRPDDSCC